MISRLLDVKQHLTTVLDELTWDNLTATQWKHLEAIRELLQPFAHQTNDLLLVQKTALQSLWLFLC